MTQSHIALIVYIVPFLHVAFKNSLLANLLALDPNWKLFKRNGTKTTSEEKNESWIQRFTLFFHFACKHYLFINKLKSFFFISFRCFRVRKWVYDFDSIAELTKNISNYFFPVFFALSNYVGFFSTFLCAFNGKELQDFFKIPVASSSSCFCFRFDVNSMFEKKCLSVVHHEMKLFHKNVYVKI